MRIYSSTDRYIPDETPLSHSHINFCGCSDIRATDIGFQHVDYPLRKAARIMYEKNIHPFASTMENGAIISFYPSDLSEENALTLKLFRRENAPFTSIRKRHEFTVVLKDINKLTVGDVRKFFEDFAVQMRMQPLDVPAFGMAYSIRAPELTDAFGTGIDGLWEEVKRCPDAYYDYRTNTTFRNYESYRMYLLGRDRKQREFESYIQEIEKENSVSCKLMEVTDFCKGRAGIVNQELIPHHSIQEILPQSPR
jgi:hypothetical protein